MAKNIILCSDGTGKAGGAIENTNVFHLYKALDVSSPHQIAFYDDGIGSTGLKYTRMLAGAFGFGFEKNILSLYRYLARNYEPGDRIFLFGFSRGAATVRALAGMIDAVGLLSNKTHQVLTHGRLDEVKLTIETLKALRYYRRALKHPEDAADFKARKTHGSVEIEMIGIWDTVYALGFPKDSSWLVIGLSKLIDKISNYFFPHRYYNYKLNSIVKNVYHALSLDDERRTFFPKVLNEVREDRPKNIEQVWFAGSHSNVGGGYPRTGLSMTTLDWMMIRAEHHGLAFNESLWHDIRAGINPSGKIYDSRAGVHIYYRFDQRHVRNLCMQDGKMIVDGNIKIHESVFRRMKLCEYAPILPNKFEVVFTNIGREPVVFDETSEEAKRLKARANLLLEIRKWVYHGLTELSLLTSFFIWYLSSDQFNHTVDSRFYNFVVSMIPGFAENAFYYAFYKYPAIGPIVIFLFLLLFFLHWLSKMFAHRTRSKINWWLFKDFDRLDLQKKI